MHYIIAILTIALGVTAYDIGDGESVEFATWFPTLDPEFDSNWIFETESFYEPFLSKLKVKRTAQLFLSPSEFENLNETEAEDTYCTRFSFSKKDQDLVELTKESFGQEPLPIPTIIHKLIPGRWDLLRAQENGELAQFLTTYVVLFCKQNGMLTVHNFMDGSMTFALASPEGVIPTPKFVEKSRKILLKLGFNPENFVFSDYSSCDPTSVIDSGAHSKKK